MYVGSNELWAYLTHKFTTGHNKALQYLAHTLQSNKHVRYYTLVIADNQYKPAPRHHDLIMVNTIHMPPQHAHAWPN